MRSRLSAPSALALAVALAALLAACGSREFTAGEFVEAANAEGAGLVLGDELETLREGQSLHAVSFATPGGDGDHDGGTLVVTAGADAALAEYERCEGSATLVCYRAANVALYFEGAPAPEDGAALEDALRAMAEG